MSRHDRQLTAAAPASAELDDLLRSLGDVASLTSADRGSAMAEFLSCSEGWRDAGASLRGAFAEDGRAGVERSVTEAGLTPGQDK